MVNAETKTLSELLGASRRLAEAAADGDWDTVGQLRLDQQDLLAQVFAGYNRQPMTAEMMSGLAQIRVYTDMVLELAKERRSSLACAARQVRKGRVAANAYADCT